MTYRGAAASRFKKTARCIQFVCVYVHVLALKQLARNLLQAKERVVTVHLGLMLQLGHVREAATPGARAASRSPHLTAPSGPSAVKARSAPLLPQESEIYNKEERPSDAEPAPCVQGIVDFALGT